MTIYYLCERSKGGKSGEDSITFMTDTKRENSAVPIYCKSLVILLNVTWAAWQGL